jgi:hypothetical protein
MNDEVQRNIVVKENSKLRLAFIGDVCIGQEFTAYAMEHGMDLLYPFAGLKDLFWNIDIGFMNLEGPICRIDELRKGVSVHLFNDPAVIDLCLQNNLRILSLSNNHIMDYGSQGLDVTQEMLAKNGLLSAGAGRDSQSARKPVIIECKNKKVGFLAYTTGELNVNAVIADDSHAGCASFSNIEDVCEQVRELNILTDVVCVSMHWGHEYYKYPSSQQIRIGHALADAGANYVIGHHPHVIQGIERYKDSLIVYSLGNFFFPPVRTDSGRLHYQKKLCKEFMVIVSEIDAGGKFDFQVTGGVVTPDFTMKLHETTEMSRFHDKVRRLSEPFFLVEYEKVWSHYRMKREKELIKEALYEAAVKASRLSVRELFSKVSPADIKRNISRLFQVLSR